jgi:mono/diheme cytochrome c family protein
MTFNSKRFSSVSSVSSVVASVFCVLCVLVSAQSKTWTMPDGAASEKNPLPMSPALLKHGESLYKSNCAGCHGKQGHGDGPNIDPKDRKHRPANLALSRNPEGVVFYKIWNGRKDPDMPEFKSRMTKDDAWAVTAYVTGPLRSPVNP